MRTDRLPKDFRERVEEAKTDPETMEIKGEIAYVSTLLETLMETAAEGGGPETWRSLLASVREAERHKAKAKKGDEQAIKDFWDAFDAICILVRDEANRTKEQMALVSLIKDKAQLIESHERVRLNRAYTLNAETALNLVMSIRDQIFLHVTNPQQLRLIAAGIGNVLKDYKTLFGANEVIDADVIEEKQIAAPP